MQILPSGSENFFDRTPTSGYLVSDDNIYQTSDLRSDLSPSGGGYFSPSGLGIDYSNSNTAPTGGMDFSTGRFGSYYHYFATPPPSGSVTGQSGVISIPFAHPSGFERNESVRNPYSIDTSGVLIDYNPPSGSGG